MSETLLGLVSHYSPSGQERGAAAWLVERMKALGFTNAFIDEAGNAVGVMGAGPRQVVLLGHIDTVPGEIPVALTPGPSPAGSGEALTPGLSPEGRGETSLVVPSSQAGWVLYGRGTVDAKGPLACFVDAVAQVGLVEGWQFVVIGAVEEERDSDGARYVVDKYRPDFLIVGEPNRWGPRGARLQRLGLGRNHCAAGAKPHRQRRADGGGSSRRDLAGYPRVCGDVQRR